jgi:hypothetical protein
VALRNRQLVGAKRQLVATFLPSLPLIAAFCEAFKNSAVQAGCGHSHQTVSHGFEL